MPAGARTQFLPRPGAGSFKRLLGSPFVTLRHPGQSGLEEVLNAASFFWPHVAQCAKYSHLSAEAFEDVRIEPSRGDGDAHLLPKVSKMRSKAVQRLVAHEIRGDERPEALEEVRI